MGCYSIEILNISGIPENLEKDGRVFLDTLPDEPIEEKIDQIRLDDDGNNNIDDLISIEIPYGGINDLICRPKVDVGIENQDYSPYEIIFIAKGVPLPYGYLTVEGKNDKDQRYTVSITTEKEHPLILANKLKVRDIPTDQLFPWAGPSNDWFQLTKVNLEAQFTNARYQDNHAGHWWIFNWYGKTFEIDRFTAMDLRPMLSPLHVLRRGFEHLGYTFSSEVLATDDFREYWLHLTDATYGGNTEVNLERYKFLAQIPNSYIYEGNEVELSDIVYTNNEDYKVGDLIYVGRYQYVVPAKVARQNFYIEYDIDVSNIVDRDGRITIQLLSFDLLDHLNDLNLTGGTPDFVEEDSITFDLSFDEDENYKGRYSIPYE